MLEQLTLRNFQAHRNLMVDLEQPITTLVGATDRGKSAVLRALRWLCLNQPSGNDFTTWGEKGTRVSLQIDGQEIVRKIGAANLYILDNGEPFRAFGIGKVPDSIAKTLNLDANNFADQEDPRFWLSDTPGTVAKSLNEIVNLDLIDEAMERVGKEVRQARSVVEVSESRLTQARGAALAMQWTERAERSLVLLELDERTLADKRARIAKLVLQLEGLSLTEGKAKRASSRAVSLGKIAELADRAAKTKIRTDLLEKSIQRLKKTEESAGKLEGITKFIELVSKGMQVANQVGKLAASIEKVKRAETTWTQTKKAWESAEKELQKFKGKACILCGAIMS